MPSPVGHSLGAMAIGWALAGQAPHSRDRWIQAGLLVAIANAPDLDFLVGRHSRETHSVGAAMLAASVAAWDRWPVAPTRGRIWLTVFAVWLSHPLFDSMSPDDSPPIGVMLLWPFSTSHWQSGLALFDPIWRNWTESTFVTHNTIAVLRELVIIGPVTAFVWWMTKERPPANQRPYS